MAHPYRDSRLRIVIADDHAVVRFGLQLLLEENPRFEVVGQAGGGVAVVPAIVEYKPDILILDLDMPGVDGFQALSRIHAAKLAVKTVVLTEDDSPDRVTKALRLGALGVIGKRAPVRFLSEAILSVGEGVRWFDPQVRSAFERAANLQAHSAATGVGRLTAREQQVATLVAQGHRYRDVAQSLGISEHTVRNHLRHVFDKLLISSRVELAVLWEREGLAQRP